MTLENVPKHEIERSYAAKRIFELALENKLFLANYEYRVQLEPPEDWLSKEFAEQDTGSWEKGVLTENKYQSFRTDQRIGSFHAGHQAKWTAHELCHSLLGFAWQKNASLFFHATAARLAELLPVVLFYYYDEAFLNRCEKHNNLKYPYVNYCKNCEESAKEKHKEKDSNAKHWYALGDAFLFSEIEAVKKSILQGVIIPNPNHKIDLASDGIAYAKAQEKRLNSEEFERYIKLFVSNETGLSENLDIFIDRIILLRNAIIDGADFPCYKADKYTWKIQDLAWRLIEVQAQTDEDLYRELDFLIEHLAVNQNKAGINFVVSEYAKLAEEYYCPSTEELFSLGYELTENYGYSRTQIFDGLKSAFPQSLKSFEQVLDTFISKDRMDRRILGFRVAAFLDENANESANLALFETILSHPPSKADDLGIYDSKNFILNPTLSIIPLKKSELETFEIFNSGDLEELNWIMILVTRENEVNLSLLDEPLAALLNKNLKNEKVYELHNKEQRDFLIEAQALISHI